MRQPTSEELKEEQEKTVGQLMIAAAVIWALGIILIGAVQWVLS